jgi:protein-disulfide isomerase
VVLLRRVILVLVLICLGCSAQSAPPDEVQRIERQVRVFYSIPANVKITVGPLRPSDFPGYSALTIHMDSEEKKQDYEFLLSKDGKTLLRLTKFDLTKDPYAEIMKKINVAGRPVRGNRDAKVTIVSFDDFQCPFCSRMHQMLFPELMKEYGDRVQFIYKDFPLTEFHPWAAHAAVNANCLAAQNNDAYWEFADHVHANQQDISREKGRDAEFAVLDRLTNEEGQKHGLDQAKLAACIKAQNEDAIHASVKEGESLGVNGTPTLFINGQELDGAVPVADVRAAIDQALEQAGVPVPAHPTSPAPSESPSAR